jgi:hypothetical protein
VVARAARVALIVCALLAGWSAPARAQRRAQLDITAPTATSPATVTTLGLFSDADMRDLLRSGFPASLKFRLELWRAGGLFNDLESGQEWELIVQYDPSAQRYRMIRRQGGRVEDLGSFATLATAQSVLERPLRVTLLPRREGSRYYYNLALDMEALSVSDMDQLERWLRGVRGGTAASAVGSGVRTLMLRMLGGEKRHFEKRSPAFTAER